MLDLLRSTSPIFKNENVELRKYNDQGESFLSFKFTGKLSVVACEQVCNEWERITSSNPSVSHTLIWQCEQMTGFDPVAKKKLMERMKYASGQTEEILIVSDNILIKGIARIMSRYSNIRLEAFNKLDEITHRIRSYALSVSF